MTQEQLVAQLTRVAVSNNPKYVYDELRKRGYSNPYMPPGDELEKELYAIYKVSHQDFFNILRGLPFDSTKTDSINSVSMVADLASELGYSGATAKTKAGEMWGWLVGTIAGQEQTTTQPTVTTTTSANVGAIIGLVVIAILAVVIVYFAFFKK